MDHAPTLHPVFAAIAAPQLRAETFDQAIAENQNTITVVFFWGHQCPNCEVAKRSLLQDADLVKALGFKWFHVNVYEDSEIGTRFGLHGIPAFYFFHNGKKLGKISPFPGMEPFLRALNELKAKTMSASGR